MVPGKGPDSGLISNRRLRRGLVPSLLRRWAPKYWILYLILKGVSIKSKNLAGLPSWWV